MGDAGSGFRKSNFAEFAPGFGSDLMATLNPKTKEIDCKIVYYGASLSGKTTNLIRIHKAFSKYVTGEMVSIDTESDRTLFFDFLPMQLGKIKGCDVRLHLYTVPGHVQYSSTRKMVLRGVDGLVFVADSLQSQRKENMLSLKDLERNLKEHDISIFKIPLVFQYNKQDLEGQGEPLMPVDNMEKELNGQLKTPSFPASALNGPGVGDTLKKCLGLTLQAIRKEVSQAQ
jgi:signal recognition particle receptor subunit beta